MRRLSLIVFLVCLVCFVSNSVFASEFWMQADPWFAATDNWMEPNQWDLAQNGPPSASPGVPPLNTTQEIKLHAGSWTTPPTHCTINSNVGIYTATTSNGGRITVNANLDVCDVANFGVARTGSKNGLRVGSLGVGGITTRGDVDQTAGTVTVSNLYLGYGGTMSSDLGGEGYYVISGGSLTVTDDPQSGGLSTGALAIASGINQQSTDTTKKLIGKLTIDSSTGTPTVTTTSLTVGGNIVAGNPGVDNVGTLEFKIGSGVVSPINCSSLVLLGNDPNTTANLVVTLMADVVQPPAIVLVKNSSGNAVAGTFDSVTLNGFHLLGYYVTYTYNADGTANDIALIPEPATIALFGLGLLALVRRPRRK